MIALPVLRNCLEGAIPSIIATCDNQGTPNLSYVSQVHYVDQHQVALTFQFFNKTHRNIRANPQATVYVTDPDTASQFRLAVLYIRTETHGALFSSLKAKLAGIAANTGMSEIFKLKGVDVYRVLDIQCVVSGNLHLAPESRPLLEQTRQITHRLQAAEDISELFDALLFGISQDMNVARVNLMLVNEQATALYTVASSEHSGIGAELPFGFGIAGVCAREQTVIRIAFGATEYNYRNAIAHHSQTADPANELETNIPFPELAEPGSQLAIPLMSKQNVLGVVYLESGRERRFSYDDEDALCIIAALFVSQFQQLRDTTPEFSGTDNSKPLPIGDSKMLSGPPLQIRYYTANNSIFINDNYLIKGVAGAIFWRLLQHFSDSGRQEFSNRELRLDSSIGLPEIGDNLESRLILLQKRLQQKTTDIAIEKSGRGRFRLAIHRPLSLVATSD